MLYMQVEMALQTPLKQLGKYVLRTKIIEGKMTKECGLEWWKASKQREVYTRMSRGENAHRDVYRTQGTSVQAKNT